MFSWRNTEDCFDSSLTSNPHSERRTDSNLLASRFALRQKHFALSCGRGEDRFKFSSGLSLFSWQLLFEISASTSMSSISTSVSGTTARTDLPDIRNTNATDDISSLSLFISTWHVLFYVETSFSISPAVCRKRNGLEIFLSREAPSLFTAALPSGFPQ